ncbi:hypothetical protein B0H66DRAFT_84901 [Apodospora peruviana]|uniref:Secreted protein n=1 Tax=Apodospora peruviana TaxID=516989 RepID=A0AAE0ITJ1_9PEZI|nr:hypothetical protein B0H66DRAFT_84901 [Apodospora peruviana]
MGNKLGKEAIFGINTVWMVILAMSQCSSQTLCLPATSPSADSRLEYDRNHRGFVYMKSAWPARWKTSAVLNGSLSQMFPFVRLSRSTGVQPEHQTNSRHMVTRLGGGNTRSPEEWIESTTRVAGRSVDEGESR